MKKQMLFKTKGMNRDLSVSAFNPEFAFENVNLRLSTNENNTTMSWVNERGTKEMVIEYTDNRESIQGIPIGTAIIDHKLILFTTLYSEEATNANNDDFIYMLWYTDTDKETMQCVQLCNKPLNFSAKYPLETLVSYESEFIKKVYWVDGRNQPRLINIAVKEPTEIGNYFANKPSSYFDFVPSLKLEEKVSVEKNVGVLGTFAPGVLQYAFSYYNNNGQESGIFYTTPLLYTSHADRGASPEDSVNNAFTITVRGVDTNFDYMRIYSIQRTSINGTPFCKRVTDISISQAAWVDANYPNLGKKATYIDTGTSGDSIDPTELLYKGGEFIHALTMAQKDNTLFLGNLKVTRPVINDFSADIKNSTSIVDSTRTIVVNQIGDHTFQLSATAYGTYPNTQVPCGGFKTGNYYRLGVQFQHTSGKWSDPIHITKDSINIDHLQTNKFAIGNVTATKENTVLLPNFEGTLSNNSGLFENLRAAGYYKVRPVFVVPRGIDRDVVCQCVATPTLQLGAGSQIETHYSSWFFRPFQYNKGSWDGVGANDTAISPISARGYSLYYQKRLEDPSRIRLSEIQGTFGVDSTFYVDTKLHTFHSPDVEFDTQLYNADLSNSEVQYVGDVKFNTTYADINIQTETPGINSNSGFTHVNMASKNSSKGIVSGLFYEDFMVDDDENKNFVSYSEQKVPARWLVYPWQGNGSLNNDCSRPADKGVQSAVLKKKVISNYRNSSTELLDFNDRHSFGNINMQLFASDEVSIVKFSSISNLIYMGNMDTMLMPNANSSTFGACSSYITPDFSQNSFTFNTTATNFNSSDWFQVSDIHTSDITPQMIKNQTARKWFNNRWYPGTSDLGDGYSGLSFKKQPVRIKYKSTPHLVGAFNGDITTYSGFTIHNDTLPIFEVKQETNKETRYGGYNEDALCANTWIPCGEPVLIPKDATSSTTVKLYFNYGDTYFQKWDCLKTYAFTPEDINQVIEIGSFMLETYVNIDGRYDRNREQMNNLNMSPRNFNLLNPVYSQTDNFFSYKIQPLDTIINNTYPNLLTWSLTKESGADVDQWTHLTLANTLEMDGDKGEITSLQRFNDQILCFQYSGISQVLYNENSVIATTEGVPIEIANSGKVQGKRYISNSIGCYNKWSIVNVPTGIYFMDNNDKNIYLFNGQLQNISLQQGFNSWCKNSILSDRIWNPTDFLNNVEGETLSSFVGYYDRQNQDVLYINKSTALAFSEKIGAFTSFYSYGGAAYLCNLDDTGVWVNTTKSSIIGNGIITKLWKHQASSEYCKFFGKPEPYSMTLIGNPEPLADKIFTNVEFRACVDGDGDTGPDPFDETFDDTFHPARFIPYLPFNKLQVWNEYQNGEATLSNRMGHLLFRHHTNDDDNSLIRKFRIWRCDIPRDKKNRRDRIRNPWVYLKLIKDGDDVIRRTEIHDVVMTYFV